MRFKTIIPVMALLLCSCGGEQTESQNTEYKVSGDTVRVSAGSALEKRYTLECVDSAEYQPKFSASGEVRAIPSKYAEVAVPFSGRIVKSLVTPGTKVSAGTALFSISSGDFMEVVRGAFDARTEMEQAELNLKRVKRMHEGKMASTRELEEAQAEASMKRRAFENAAASLKVFGADINSITPGQPLTVRAPIAGTVIKNDLVTGQYVKDDAEPVLTVADLDKVWVVANVKEKDFGLLRGIERVGVTIASQPDTVIEGKVFHINEILDPSTRTVELVVECDNHDGLMKPNMFGTVEITDAPKTAILVPTSALRRKEDIAYVMRKAGPNVFTGVRVTTGRSDGERTVVLSGLEPGDTIVTKGAFYLPEPEF